MSAREDQNRRLLRARDAMDHDYASPLDIPSLATVALMSPAHFSRQLTATFGETPHRYLQRRRIERALALLRDHDRTGTDVAMAVGYDSLGTVSRTFRESTGRRPCAFRDDPPIDAPGCIVRRWTRPSSSGEAPPAARP